MANNAKDAKQWASNAYTQTAKVAANHSTKTAKASV